MVNSKQRVSERIHEKHDNTLQQTYYGYTNMTQLNAVKKNEQLNNPSPHQKKRREKEEKKQVTDTQEGHKTHEAHKDNGKQFQVKEKKESFEKR